MKASTWHAGLRRAWNRYVLDSEVEREVIRQGARKSVIALAREHKNQSLNFYLKLLVAYPGNA